MSHLPVCSPPCQDAPLCQCPAPALKWADLFGIDPTYDEIEACPVCAATGPCGYDTEGRPVVHTTVFPTAATGSEATC